ncbi:hypothetical protein [Nocardioides korecus]
MTDRDELVAYHRGCRGTPGKPGGFVSTVFAVGQVDLWGAIAGPVIGDDWPGTVRGSHAQIVGDLTIITTSDGLPDGWRLEDLSEHYAVSCELGVAW